MRATRLKLVVKRRQQDANSGQTANFTVRVETDRSGVDHVLESWETDSVTDRLYKDFPLELTGADTEVEREIEVTQNGKEDGDWVYEASILPIEDYEGKALPAAEEAQYWTVKRRLPRDGSGGHRRRGHDRHRYHRRQHDHRLRRRRRDLYPDPRRRTDRLRAPPSRSGPRNPTVNRQSLIPAIKALTWSSTHGRPPKPSASAPMLMVSPRTAPTP